MNWRPVDQPDKLTIDVEHMLSIVMWMFVLYFSMHPDKLRIQACYITTKTQSPSCSKFEQRNIQQSYIL